MMDNDSTREPSSWRRARQLTSDGAKPGLEELFDLIHEINPTGSALTGETRDQSYEIKARLQSLLIESFGDQIRLEEVEGTHASTIGLRHRFGARDACHALVRSLSPRARSWVQWQRDLAESAELPTTARTEVGAPKQKRQGTQPPSATPAPPESLIQIGEAALAEFDFERARDSLRAALDRPETLANPREALRATRALVRLLGDHLAAYEELLELRRNLHPSAEGDAEIRCLLALAAAKSQRPGLATQLLQNLDLDRVHEVHLELAQQALRAQEVEACQSWLDQVPTGSSFAAQALALHQSLHELRQSLAAPLEAELLELEDQADPESLGGLAHRILDLDPDNHLARQALVRIRRDREAGELQQTMERIEAFLEQRDAENAGLLLRRLDPDGQQYTNLSKRHKQLREELEKAQEQSTAANLRAQLGSTPTASWLQIYWKASDPVRHAALSGIDWPWVGWINELGPATSHSRAQAIAAALSSLALAEESWKQGQACETEALLIPHQDILHACKRGRLWMAEVREAARREQEEQRLSAQRAQEAAERIAQQARDHAEQERREFLQSQWTETLVEGSACADLLDEIPVDHLCAQVTTPLQPDRNRLIHVEALARRIHIHAFALDAAEEYHLVLRSPKSFRLLSAQVLGDRLWLLGETSALEIDLDRMQILNETDLADLHWNRENWLGPSSRRKGGKRQKSKQKKRVWAPMSADSMPSPSDFDSALLAPGGRHIWFGQGLPPRWGIAEIKGCEGLGFFEHRRLVWPIWGSTSALLVSSTDGVQCHGMDAEGQLQWEYRSHGALVQVLAHPTKRGLIVLTTAASDLHQGLGTVLVAQERSLIGEHMATLELGPVDLEQPIEAVASQDESRLYVSASLMDGGSVLMAIEASGDGLRLLWQRSLSGELALFQDSENRRALAFYRDGQAARLLPPDQVSARRALSFSGLQLHVPIYKDLEDCHFDDAETLLQVEAFEAVLPLLRRAEYDARIGAWLGEPRELTALLGLHSRAIPAEARQGIVDRLQKDYGEQPRARLLTTVPLLEAGKPEQALALLDEIDTDGFPLPQQQHLLHLRALCLFALGQYDLSDRTLRKASRLRCKTCALAPLRQLVDTLRQSPRKLARTTREAGLAGLISRLLAYDQSVSASEGNLDEVGSDAVPLKQVPPEELTQTRDLLAAPMVARSGHLQSLARMAEVELLSATGGPLASRSWRSTRILGCFLEAWARSPEVHGARGFPLLGASTWGPKRLRQLAHLTSEALDEPLPAPHKPVEILDLADLSPLAAGASIATLVDSSPGATSHGQRLKALQALDRHELRLLSEAQDCRQRRLMARMVGLVVDPSHPAAPRFLAARALLRSHKARGPEVALPVTLEAAMNLLSTWPNLLQDFSDFLREAQAKHRNRLTLLLITPQGAGFRQSRT